MTNTGIFTQSAASVLQDVEEFYFGGALPWYHGSKLTEDGLHVSITLDDPESDDESKTKDYEPNQGSLSKDQAEGVPPLLLCRHQVRTARIRLRPRP